MGPQVEVKGTVYGTVASFSVLMQPFYKIWDWNEKISTYTSRTEGALNEIRLKNPDRLYNAVVEGFLSEHLFHGMKKESGTHYAISLIIPQLNSAGSGCSEE